MTAPTIPTSPAELEETLADDTKLKAIFENGGLANLVKNYADAFAKKDKEFSDQVKAEVQKVTAAWLKENAETGGIPAGRPDMRPHADVQRSKFYNAAAPGAKADKLFANMAEFLGATHHKTKNAKHLDLQGQLEEITNSFGSQVPADGGFLIPEALRAELLRVSLETAIVRSRARVIPMDSLTVPFPTLDSTSNASSVFGGVTAYWTEEAGALVESQAKFGRVKLEAKKLTAYAEVPNELYQDSIISLQAFINEIFPEAIAWFEDVAFFSGSGVGEPLGFLNCPASVATAAEAGQATNTIVWENIVKMYARMMPTSLGRAVWIVNQETFPELATMALSVGTGGSAIWLNNGTQGPPMTILGRPVVVTEKANQLGTTGDISFVDFGYYLIGDRQVMQAEQSPHYKFANDKTAIRFIERLDGRPWIQSAITPRKGANTLSPFVQLATRP